MGNYPRNSGFIQEKLDRLPHFFNRLTMIDVTVDLQNELSKSVEVIVKSEHKHDFVASESNGDLYAAVDLVVDKLERQISRHKEKLQDHRRDQSTSEVAGAPQLENPADE